ncbi:MAG TPA: SemiSWEET transporter [Cyclobacteriaceae bacterium]|nr:SemiSWEET transporter [Cyclobacteriaceae bacterium]
MSESLVQIVGVVAGILTSVSLLPQVVKVYREKSSEQISIGYIITLMSGLLLWIVYGILRSDTPVIATNVFSISVSVVMLVLGIKYKDK